jgi:predicted metallopeptidase
MIPGASGSNVGMKIDADWRYMVALLSVSFDCIKRMTDEEIDKIIIHELFHCVVNEMREDGIGHEERTVTMLTKIAGWVWNAGKKEVVKNENTM